jgi:hypothetical protein
MESNNKYIPGTSYLVDYAIEHYGAEVIEEEYYTDLRPPFPCLTGAYNTSNSYKIDKNLYPKILAAGVDTLELNFGVSGHKQSDVFRHISEVKIEAASAGYKGSKGKAIDLFGKEFMVLARGSKGGYEYLLKNGDIELQIMPEARGGKPSPELRVIFRSPYLWRVGEISAYNEVIEFLNEWFYLVYCKVSRADLCVDMLIPLPDIDRRNQVVSVLKKRDMYYGGDFQLGSRNTGYQFGHGGIACRFYDKVYEMSIKGNGHIKPLWLENGWDGESPVSRFELQLRREGLRRFDTKMDFATFQDSKADIWDYGTNRLIRIVQPGSATRKERAQVIECWKDYQNCTGLFGVQQGILPYKQQNKDWLPLVKQANGCMASAFARLAADLGEEKAELVLKEEWGGTLPQKVIEAGLLQKARFTHMS